MRLEFEDDRHGDEIRYNTIGLVQDILFVVYVDRQNNEDGEDIRLISARRATKKEADAYNNIVYGRI
ncbi:MAG: BrnT family toxin [Lachnospiraceae bacterium]|nr:BrnT family toxin [Lachnospiraceae bacterium]